MKKTIIASVLLAFLVLSLAGCSGGFPGSRKEPVSGYRSGSQGIVINFLPNYPRAQLFDDETMDIILEVRNKGSSNVGFAGDSIYLSGFDPGIVTGISQYGATIPQMEGVTQYNAEGGYDTLEFKAELYPLKMKNIDSYPMTLLATLCYGYKTLASNNVCIDPDPFSATTQKKVCTPSSVSFGTQGAPVAVGTVEVEPSPRVTRFKIHVSNVGAGTVFKPGSDYLAKCSPYHSSGLEFNEIDRVRLSKVEVSGQVITPSCKPVDSDGSIRLINGQATVFCELGGIGTGPSYSTPMTVELDYGYRSTISKAVQIVQTP